MENVSEYGVLFLLFNLSWKYCSTLTQILVLFTDIRKCFFQFMLLWVGYMVEWIIGYDKIKTKFESMNKLF